MQNFKDFLQGNEKELTESQELIDIASDMAIGRKSVDTDDALEYVSELTEYNEHSLALLLIARVMKNDFAIAVMEAVAKQHEKQGHLSGDLKEIRDGVIKNMQHFDSGVWEHLNQGR